MINIILGILFYIGIIATPYIIYFAFILLTEGIDIVLNSGHIEVLFIRSESIRNDNFTNKVSSEVNIEKQDTKMYKKELDVKMAYLNYLRKDPQADRIYSYWENRFEKNDARRDISIYKIFEVD